MPDIPLGSPLPGSLTLLEEQDTIRGFLYFDLGEDWTFAPLEDASFEGLPATFQVRIELDEDISQELEITPIVTEAKLKWNHGSHDFVNIGQN